ncbi:hypothetical protein BKA81DRAFT_101220 [Phyllosticta paracitricarpa]
MGVRCWLVASSLRFLRFTAHRSSTEVDERLTCDASNDSGSDSDVAARGFRVLDVVGVGPFARWTHDRHHLILQDSGEQNQWWWKVMTWLFPH